MKKITGTAITPTGFCGFGYVDEGLPKEEAIAKLKLEMQKKSGFTNVFIDSSKGEKKNCY